MSPALRVLTLPLLLGALLVPISARAQTPIPPLAPYPLPSPVAASVAALAAHADVLVLGEIHGTQEVPQVTASLLPMLDKSGYRALALEVNADQQAALSDWAVGKTTQVPSFYNGPHDDGRGNMQMLALVRAAAAAPYHWTIICFDASAAQTGTKPGDTWQARDADMARNFSVQWRHLAPNSKVLALCGNLHARTANHGTVGKHLADLWPSFAANVQSAYPQKRVLSLDIEPQRGSYFNGGQVKPFTGALITVAKTRHRPTDDWDLELGLPCATPATFLTPSSVHAPTPFPLDGLTIEAVHITGNVHVPTDTILRAMHSKAGEAFHLHTLQADMRAIYTLADFEGIGPFDVQKTPQGTVIITLPVQEKPHPFVAPAQNSAAAPVLSVAAVAQALSEMQTIKPGMTCQDLLRVFVQSPDLRKHGPSGGTYSYRKCPWIKVRVMFRHSPVAKLAKGSTASPSPQDIIRTLSSPFLEAPDGLLDPQIF